ncbi:acyl-ACP--UDP-N- acetylglucosamine O-acyltransferase [Cellulomonas phragmiteti]|uniref:Acyl-[acyl-carrier-protein]--UDP-N-acetylglucosam ine O-acyltransferase n=1 Tax=Cellulomonas phragmiteti TaxID=478780 RepID=A0ABQ4DJU4_9CELL|nr:acyl-ACP--UDP-N- acetylglucosamine O-acyltransferase [Cellulomonas phragmiteti]GIG39617.1 acyl-[acyl-carrier-protein]--UDP-N-acetylglucosam ine O-acyltransferase [Cellulomonas phragmiteti]
MTRTTHDGNTIHPSAVIGDEVELGTGNVIGPHVVILGPVRIGDENWFGSGATIGAPPEVRGAAHPAQWLTGGGGEGVVIGDRNVVREQAVVHQGWQAVTTLGDDCFVMNRAYVAHDCRLGDGVTLASGVALGGHVVVGERATLGMGALVHQRRLVAPGAMVGMGAVVSRDVAPFAKVYGNPARVRGANVVGMQRQGVLEDAVAEVERAYALGRRPDPELLDDELREVFARWDEAHAVAR